MKKRLSSILRSMAIGGLLASAVVRVLIQFTASPVPDPVSGRTEPSLFAPAISSNWQYITPWQSLLLAVLTGARAGLLFRLARCRLDGAQGGCGQVRLSRAIPRSPHRRPPGPLNRTGQFLNL